eukprot:CAMPEP_0197533034 /NCGR_PEP_ID=MMETSP1318-20131121/41980_1 /TAXON_ID=552666 /ORGANISM="Partenskyella glossopodia, Strain RCC365" /LENGTH=43 /DNA_ID= /DNA_START= /DNA_END= /DNA_ORIENTATION=
MKTSYHADHTTDYEQANATHDDSDDKKKNTKKTSRDETPLRTR